jgi:hypothetical protein
MKKILKELYEFLRNLMALIDCIWKCLEILKLNCILSEKMNKFDGMIKGCSKYNYIEPISRS